VVGHRGLAQLLEDGALILGGEGVLDELLGNGRAALHHALLDDVLVEGAADAAQVDAVVRVEALVLDRDDRVLHHRRDLVLAQEQALLVAGEDADLLAGAVQQHRVAGGRLVERRQVGGDRHHHPEDGRDGGQEADPDEQGEQPQLADPHTPATRRRPVAVLGAQRDDGRSVAAAVAGGGRRVESAVEIAHTGRSGRAVSTPR
jgi:hypothetical protein